MIACARSVDCVRAAAPGVASVLRWVTFPVTSTSWPRQQYPRTAAEVVLADAHPRVGYLHLQQFCRSSENSDRPRRSCSLSKEIYKWCDHGRVKFDRRPKRIYNFRRSHERSLPLAD